MIKTAWVQTSPAQDFFFGNSLIALTDSMELKSSD